MQRDDRAQRARDRAVRQLHLHRDRRPRRRVPGARRAAHRLRARAAAVRARDRRAGLAAARDPRARPLLRRRTDHVARHVYLGEAQRLRADLDARHNQERSGARVHSSASGASRAYPVAGGYAEQAPLVRLASNESPYPPLPVVREASSARSATLNRYPDPTSARCAARSATATACRRAHRGRQRLLRHPARRRRGAARAGRRARLRLAVVLGLPAARRRLGRARDHGGARRARSATT